MSFRGPCVKTLVSRVVLLEVVGSLGGGPIGILEVTVGMLLKGTMVLCLFLLPSFSSWPRGKHFCPTMCSYNDMFHYVLPHHRSKTRDQSVDHGLEPLQL